MKHWILNGKILRSSIPQMKLVNSYRLPITVFLLLLLYLASNVERTPSTPSENESDKETGFALSPPAFVNVAHAAEVAQSDELLITLDNAGVIAYIFVEGGIDVERVPSNLFYEAEERTEQFVKGIVKPANYDTLPSADSAARPYVVFHQNGWIIAYLEDTQPSSALFDWANFYEDGREKTSLDRILERSIDIFDVQLTNPTYYDFRYPEATKLMLIADNTDTSRVYESFSIEIPASVSIYEISWSNAVFDSDGGNPITATCGMDGDAPFSTVKPIGKDIGDSDHQIGTLGASRYEGRDHYFELTNLSGMSGKNYCGIAIVYSD